MKDRDNPNRQAKKIVRQSKTKRKRQTKQNCQANSVVRKVSQKTKKSEKGFTTYRIRKYDQHSDKDKTEMQDLSTLGMTKYNEGQVCGNRKEE